MSSVLCKLARLTKHLHQNQDDAEYGDLDGLCNAFDAFVVLKKEKKQMNSHILILLYHVIIRLLKNKK